MADADVVVIGGGVIGAATACFLARDHGLRVRVLERDLLHTQASSALSASSIRQQFSTPINIALSQASLAFLRRAEQELAVDGEGPAIGLVERGYLYLASAEGATALQAQHRVQRDCGADVALLSANELAARFPWLDTEGIALGSLGLSGEGWFDGPALLQGFFRKARSLGVSFVEARATAFESGAGRVHAVLDGTGQRHRAAQFVIAAGAWSAPLAGQLGLPLPVRARKRDVFVFSSPAQLDGCPLVIDPSGFWFRPEGRFFLCGAPPRGDDADDVPLAHIDRALFDDWLWPRLARRVPAFQALRAVRAWAGYYEMNTVDHNGLVGVLPGIAHVHVACGFSGHGMQHAPAIAEALARHIVTGSWGALDLSPLSPARLARGELLIERNVI
jgi:glycine/D-amino acid oxidase-like deaminating enzyme